jgi:uncharacterized protein (DUF302 family)
MSIIRNILAVIGLLAIILLGFGYQQWTTFTAQLDPEAPHIYREFLAKFMAHKDPADAMIWSVPVAEGMSPEDVVTSLKSLAVQHSLLFVGESPFYKQAAAVTGKPYRYVNFLSFCDVRVGMKMTDYNDAYTAFMPCRIAIVEDSKGALSLHSMNLDLMIHGGKELPPDLKEGAIRVRNAIRKIMEGAAAGEF